MEPKDLSENRAVTLNALLEEQRSLNMRMLLAVRLRDAEAQEELTASLTEVRLQIERLRSGAARRHGLPQ